MSAPSSDQPVTSSPSEKASPVAAGSPRERGCAPRGKRSSLPSALPLCCGLRLVQDTTTGRHDQKGVKERRPDDSFTSKAEAFPSAVSSNCLLGSNAIRV